MFKLANKDTHWTWIKGWGQWLCTIPEKVHSHVWWCIKQRLQHEQLFFHTCNLLEQLVRDQMFRLAGTTYCNYLHSKSQSFSVQDLQLNEPFNILHSTQHLLLLGNSSECGQLIVFVQHETRNQTAPGEGNHFRGNPVHFHFSVFIASWDIIYPVLWLW